MHTTGLDVSDKKTHICTLDDNGEVFERRTIPTTVLAVRKAFDSREKLRVVLEVGPHSRWMHVCLEAAGHEVIVGNPAKIPTITSSNHKSDERDTEQPAPLGRVDIRLLHPVEHRSDSAQADLMHIRSRDVFDRTANRTHKRRQKSHSWCFQSGGRGVAGWNITNNASDGRRRENASGTRARAHPVDRQPSRTESSHQDLRQSDQFIGEVVKW